MGEPIPGFPPGDLRSACSSLWHSSRRGFKQPIRLRTLLESGGGAASVTNLCIPNFVLFPKRTRSITLPVPPSFSTIWLKTLFASLLWLRTLSKCCDDKGDETRLLYQLSYGPKKRMEPPGLEPGWSFDRRCSSIGIRRNVLATKSERTLPRK